MEYQEIVPMPRWMQALLLLGVVGVLAALLLPPLTGDSTFPGWLVFYPVVGLSFIFIVFATINFQHLAIRVSWGKLEFSYGVLKKSMPLDTVTESKVTRYDWLVYGGWGIRLSTKGRRAWSVPGVPGGVEVKAMDKGKERSYFISSRQPRSLLEAIQSNQKSIS